MDQTDKLKSFTLPSSIEELISTRAKMQYIASCTRPDLSAAVQLLASKMSTSGDFVIKKLNSLISWSHATKDVGLSFKPMDRDTVYLRLFIDASFANAENLRSQLGIVIVLFDEHGNNNLLHYGSSRCSRVTRSVMAAEHLALVYGFH